MDLLSNAVASIQLGVEDYQVGSHPRLMSAVRNIHAGILLLYKEALLRLSPEDSNEVLIKSRIAPSLDDSGEVVFLGEGKKTVDTQQIKDRFKALAITTNWKRFDRIADARNDIEHYFPQLTQAGLQGVVADAFVIVRQFVSEELKEEPGKLLGEPTWQAMLKVAELYDAERARCDAAIESAEWSAEAVKAGVAAVTCSSCGSDLLEPGAASDSWSCPVLNCRACGTVLEPDTYVPAAVQEGLSREMYLAHTDGDDIPYIVCPECGEESYIVADRQCALCGESVEHKCVLCGNAIIPEELDSSPHCGWCARQMGKED